MGNLLKADFFRVFRTRIVYVSLIIAVALPLFIAGVFALSEASVGEVDPSLASDSLGDLLISNVFSPIMSFSYIFAVFPVIVIMMDFGNGTIRDKVIHGYTRHQIFAAHFIISLIYSAVLTLLFTAVYTICGFCAFGVDAIKPEMTSTFLVYYALGYLGVVLIAAIGCGLALSFLNAGAIILTIIGVLVFTNLGTILELIFYYAGLENYDHFLCLLPTFYTSRLSQFIAYRSPDGLDLAYIIEAIVGPLVLSGGFYALGTFVFNKRDFK